MEVRVLLTISIVLACAGAAIAQPRPQPPCGVQPVPEYAQPGKLPNFHVWAEGNPGKQWMPPACTGWTPKDGALVAIASQFRFLGNIDGLLSRFAGISTLQGLQYWSVTDSGWETLITNATALDGPNLAQPRADFTVAEMRGGGDLYFTETDNRSTRPIIYRMRVTTTSTDIVVAIENVTPVQIFMLKVFSPGDLQSVHFLTRSAPGLWSYYALARTGVAIGTFIGVKEESYANRALALYSHFTGTLIEPVRQ
jgi:Family of unknown function (DUF6675)